MFLRRLVRRLRIETSTLALDRSEAKRTTCVCAIDAPKNDDDENDDTVDGSETRGDASRECVNIVQSTVLVRHDRRCV